MRSLVHTSRFVLLVTGACGCASSTSSELQVDVLVESDPGRPLRGVAVDVDGQDIGTTGSGGEVRTSIAVEPGDLVTLAARCPKGFSGEAKPRTFRVRRALPSSSPGRARVRLRCQPDSRLAVFLVRTLSRRTVDVFVDGEWAADTSSHGIAHLSRRAPVGTEFLVELVPRGSKLRPARIARVFTMPDSDDFFVFDQSFRSIAPPRRSARSKPRILRIE